MILRTTLALLLSAPVALAAGRASAGTAHHKPSHAVSHARSRAHVANRARGRGLRQHARRDPDVVIATLDDGLAFDTPRDAQGHAVPEAMVLSGAYRPGRTSLGLASWYGGKEWQGRRMSDGSRFEQDALTAAHATLPLGSYARVTAIGSGRAVVVRITDRPGTRRRIVDLSRAAAARIGILDRGVAQVSLDPL